MVHCSEPWRIASLIRLTRVETHPAPLYWSIQTEQEPKDFFASCGLRLFTSKTPSAPSGVNVINLRGLPYQAQACRPSFSEQNNDTGDA